MNDSGAMVLFFIGWGGVAALFVVSEVVRKVWRKTKAQKEE